jgi:tmRNA-binding protein
VIPTEILFRWNLIKLKISLAKWKKKYEKKRILKEKSLEKNARIELSGRYK